MRALALLFVMVACSLAPLRGAEASERMNVLFFLVDDLGYTDLGCYGSTFYETPNIDRLAESGARLTNAYAACQVCSPTRASIMTGKYPARLHTTDWFGAPQPERWGRRNTPLLPAPYIERLPAEETTLAEAFLEAGYRTFFAGKWHLGPKGSWPEDHGFEINKGGCDWGRPKGKNGFFSPYGIPGFEEGPEGEHLTARLAQETCRFLEENADEPFLAYLSFYTVHTPLQSPKELEAKYNQKKAALGATREERWGREGRNRARLVQDHAIYGGMVESLDSAVGQVLDKLAELGLEDKTVIVFTSDNGGLSTAEGHPTSNLPLRAGKGWMYEGGVREPTLVRWPGVTEPGLQCDVPITSTDYYPTLLEAAQLPPMPDQHVDGVSIVAALKGEEQDRGPIYWHYPHYSNQGGGPAAAVRDGRWKLIEWYEGNRLELFDLEADLEEKQDRSNDEPATVQRLKGLLDQWRDETEARRPSPNPAYNPRQR